MPKIIPLNSQIFSTGTKFMVTDETKDNTIGPGSTGFVSYVKGHDQDHTNVVYINAVITKRGKTGKKRISNNELSTPIFDFKDDNLSKIMPEERRRYYVHIEPIITRDTDIFKMQDIDFLGWAHAQTKYIHKLSTRSKHILVWPADPGHSLNKMLSVNESFIDNIDTALTDSLFREKFVKNIRIIESTLVKSALLYMCKVSELEARAIIDLCKEELNIGNPKIMKETLQIFEKKRDSLQTLVMNHGNNNTVNNVKEVINNISW